MKTDKIYRQGGVVFSVLKDGRLGFCLNTKNHEGFDALVTTCYSRDRVYEISKKKEYMDRPAFQVFGYLCIIAGVNPDSLVREVYGKILDFLIETPEIWKEPVELV